MSISPLSASLLSDLSQTHRQNPFQEVRQDFQQLASALQSGNLSDAQSAYSSIQQVLQSAQGSSGAASGSNGTNTIQNDFSALGQALQSGDLTQAQSAFAQLQSDAQSARQARSSDTAGTAQAQDQYVSSTAQNLSPAQQVQQDYAQLASALQSGDVTGAQTAYTALQQALGAQTGNSTSPTTATGATTDPILNDFNSLGQALQSGNLSQAQSAFAQLQSDVQSAQQNQTSSLQSLAQALKSAIQGHHHHGGGHHGGGSKTQTTNSSTSSTAATSTTTNGNVTINIYL